MKGKRTRFRTSIVHVPSMDDEARHTSDSHNMAVVLPDHRGQELSNHPKVSQGVDFEGLADEVLGAVEDGGCAADAGVVDEHGWIADCFADLCCCSVDLGGRCDIALVEKDAGSYLCVSG